MTTYQNQTPANPSRTEQPVDRRDVIAKVCLDCYNNTNRKEDFTKSIRLIKHLILQPSKTPHLDEAYLDGFTTALETIKGNKP